MGCTAKENQLMNLKVHATKAHVVCWSIANSLYIRVHRHGAPLLARPGHSEIAGNIARRTHGWSKVAGSTPDRLRPKGGELSFDDCSPYPGVPGFCFNFHSGSPPPPPQAPPRAPPNPPSPLSSTRSDKTTGPWGPFSVAPKIFFFGTFGA